MLLLLLITVIPLAKEVPFIEESPDIDGQEGLKLIFGIRVHGTAFKTRRENKFIWVPMIMRRQPHTPMILLP